MAHLIISIEFLATFGLLIGFCLWQLHSLNKLDREEAEQEAAKRDKAD